MKSFLTLPKLNKNARMKELEQMAEAQAKAAQEEKNIQTSQPGDRISQVMNRMYKIIASADVDMNSCYIETENLSINETVLQRRGTFDDFLRTLTNLVSDNDRERFLKIFTRQNLHKILFDGKSFISEIYTIGGLLHEIRVEKIPELKDTSTRVRCCVYIRQILSNRDTGRINPDENTIVKQDELTENDRLIGSLFVGSYELNVEKNYIAGYMKEQGQFRKMNEYANLKVTVDGYIQRGLIAPESAQLYQSFCRKGVLEKHTMKGSYTVAVKLRVPGSTKYFWYEDIFFRIGNTYRAYRRNIDEYRKTQETKLRLEEQTKFANYNQTMLENMASLVEFRNVESGAHVSNVRKITELLLSDIADRSPHYGIDRPQINIISEAATIHDIGKITIPDSILNKPARLTPEEYEIMKNHTTDGATIIERMATEEMKDLYDVCRDVVLHHHERYDGNGYPEGLVGDKNSIAAQTVGVADAFDALVSERCYKEAYPHDVAFKMIEEGQCGVFNERIIESLRVCLDKIRILYDYTDIEKKKDEGDSWQEN